MRVIVAGGGIGGLTTAIALRHHGIDALVLEQAEIMAEIGAGIQIASNAAIVLREIGLEQAIRAVGVKPQSYDYRDLRTGRMLYKAPLGDEAAGRYGAPMYNIHRADLVQILFDAVPAEAKRLGARCTAVSQDRDGVEVRLQTGETLRADALVGCDGIHSVVRQHLRGNEEKHFANILMWRSLIPAERLDGLGLEERGNYWFGPGRTLITYWVRPKNLYSILASVPAHEVQRESWTDSGDISEMLRSFDDAEPRARAMLEQCRSVFITGMYYRDPIDSWTSGRITLLGDAAHPMVPFLAAGAGQSIEDAWTFARVLARRQDDVPGALLEYERRRLPRTTRIQAGARAAVKLMHETDGGRVRDRNGRWKGMARIDPLAETSWGLAWDYNVVKAVEGPPGEVLNVTGLREGKRLQRPEGQRAFDLWKYAFRPEDVARGHDGLREAYDRFLTTNFPLPDNVEAVEDELGDVKAFRVAASDAARGHVVLHFHGGGYLIGSARGSLEYASRLAAAVGGVCYTVDYRLAPEHPYPAAIDDAVCAYRALLARGIPASSILLSGESAGGGLAVALALALRTAGDPLARRHPRGCAVHRSHAVGAERARLQRRRSRGQSRPPDLHGRVLLPGPRADRSAGVAAVRRSRRPAAAVRDGHAGRSPARRHDAPGGARRKGRRRRDAAPRRGFRPRLHDLSVPAGNPEHDGRGRDLGAAQAAPQRYKAAGRGMTRPAARSG